MLPYKKKKSMAVTIHCAKFKTLVSFKRILVKTFESTISEGKNEHLYYTT